MRRGAWHPWYSLALAGSPAKSLVVLTCHPAAVLVIEHGVNNELSNRVHDEGPLRLQPGAV
jgi:hypothetical protein